MKRYRLNIMAVLLLVGGLFVGCIREDLNNLDGSDQGVNLVISVAGMGNKQLTREGTSERTDRSRIEDMNIVLADASGVIREIIYVPNPTTGTSDPGMENNGLINGNLPTDGGPLVYHVGSRSWAGKSKIFIVCNYWQIDKKTGEIQPNMNNLNNCLTVGTSTIDNLKALQQGTPRKPGIMTSTLFGEAKPDTGTDEHGGQNYTCELQRTTAMITVAITSGNGDEMLKDGVKITPRSICLHNVPVNCNIGLENTVITDDRIWEEGLVQQVGWESLTSANHGTTVGGHGDDPNIVPVFMFENLQGTYGDENGNQINKAPEPEKEKYCSYIEVIADYLYVPQGSGTNQKYISGPIKYRLYLGENITNDFNVHRNKHYQVTLSLKGMGGLVEDGKTDEQGNFIAEGVDASWRVDSEKVTGGGSFLSDGLNMSSNGFLSYVGFVKEANKNYVIYCEEGLDHASWLLSQCENISGMQTPTKDFPAKVYSAAECGGEEGVSYVKIFARPWIDENPFNWSNYATNFNDWIENGKREATLILAEKGGTSSRPTYTEVSKFTLRQWLPMPVMVDNNGNKLDSTNPNDASFYYSRIDVYEGREIPWGPSNSVNWNFSSLKDNVFTIYTRFPQGWNDPTRKYNFEYGFDNIVAIYATYPNDFTFQSDYGRPGSAVSMAIYRAGNAWSQSGNVVENNFSQLARIGLPTLEEWRKIREYGIVDPRFPFSNVPYWSSSMNGNQSGTFNPQTGVENWEQRLVKHRTRLVYHKNDFAQK